jgi:hypothetical protein
LKGKGADWRPKLFEKVEKVEKGEREREREKERKKELKYKRERKR